MLRARLDRSEALKSAYKAMKIALEKDAAEDPATFIIQRQLRVFVCRRRMRKTIEARKRAALVIQSWFRGHAIRKISKYGVGYDRELAMEVKAK